MADSMRNAICVATQTSKVPTRVALLYISLFCAWGQFAKRDSGVTLSSTWQNRKMYQSLPPQIQHPALDENLPAAEAAQPDAVPPA